MVEISDIDRYLDRMSKPLAEKLKIAKYIPMAAKRVLDVGCADGVLTSHLATMFPHLSFKGIDLNEKFINIAKEKYKDIPNLSFECIYLREHLAENNKYGAVLFCSVLHEFYSYGEGISSVLKALADAHEILDEGGRILIRDMILPHYTNDSNIYCGEIREKIKKSGKYEHLVASFEKKYGDLANTLTINHFLLKYLYEDNWEHELEENYVAVTFEKYRRIFELLSMKIQVQESYTIEFLKNKWTEDFGLTEDEMVNLRSTGILGVEK